MDRLTIYDHSRLYREALQAYLAGHYPSINVTAANTHEGLSRIEFNGKPIFSFRRDVLNGRDIVVQVGRFMARDERQAVRLTRREAEVQSYLVQGYTNKQIAIALSLQEVTVKLHVRGICRKLGVQNRTQAALKARENLFE